MPVPATDEALAAAVRQALGHHPEVNIQDLRVEAHNGVVRLTGVSPNLNAVRRASEIAAQTAGVRSVDSVIAVENPAGLGDRELQERAARAAAEAGYEIQIDIQDGAAVLRGEIDNPAALDRVIAAVEQTPGVRSLRSEVTFRQSGGPSTAAA